MLKFHPLMACNPCSNQCYDQLGHRSRIGVTELNVAIGS
jgi:hypothetical protein